MTVTTEIPWGDGSGDKIYLTRNASEGDQNVQVSSDANTGSARSKVVTFASGVGNIQRQLTINQAAGTPQEYTLTKYPSSYDSDHQYASMSNASNAYTSYNSSTYALINLTTGSQAETWVYFKFDTSSIPANAIIEEVTCTAKTYCSNNSSAVVASKTWRLYSGTTAKGDASANIATGSAGSQTLDGGSWTREEISDIRLRMYARRGTSNTSTSYNIRLYGATLTIKYKA